MNDLLNFIIKHSTDFIISFLASALWAFLIYFLRPGLKISIKKQENINDQIKITVENLNSTYSLNNIKIEACLIASRTINGRVKQQTCHFRLNLDSFIMLKEKNQVDDGYERSFTITELMEPDEFIDFNGRTINNKNYIEALQSNENYLLRVRVHGYHALSNLGKAYEQNFKWSESTQTFENA